MNSPSSTTATLLYSELRKAKQPAELRIVNGKHEWASVGEHAWGESALCLQYSMASTRKVNRNWARLGGGGVPGCRPAYCAASWSRQPPSSGSRQASTTCSELSRAKFDHEIPGHGLVLAQLGAHHHAFHVAQRGRDAPRRVAQVSARGRARPARLELAHHTGQALGPVAGSEGPSLVGDALDEDFLGSGGRCGHRCESSQGARRCAPQQAILALMCKRPAAGAAGAAARMAVMRNRQRRARARPLESPFVFARCCALRSAALTGDPA